MRGWSETYPFLKLVQDVDLDKRLLVKPLLVPNDLDCTQSTAFVINATNHLTKAALSQDIDHFITIAQVISKDNVVVTSLVVIAKIGSSSRRDVTNMLFGMLGTTEPNTIFVINDLTLFVNVQYAGRGLNCLSRSHAVLGRSSFLELVGFARCALRISSLCCQSPHLLVGRNVIFVKAGYGTAIRFQGSRGILWCCRPIES